MNFTVDCKCGRQIEVTSADAGSEKLCACGVVNSIPALSELRRRSGQKSYDVSIADKLRFMWADGLLPSEAKCLKCGLKTNDVLACDVECERTWAAGGGFWATSLAMLAVIVAHVHNAEGNTEARGRETLVHAPLRLCADCKAAVGKRKQMIVELLRRVPDYAKLLDEFPQASVFLP